MERKEGWGWDLGGFFGGFCFGGSGGGGEGGVEGWEWWVGWDGVEDYGVGFCGMEMRWDGEVDGFVIWYLGWVGRSGIVFILRMKRCWGPLYDMG